MKIHDITGSGGGGGGASFHEDPNTLQVNQTFRALYAIGEGQIAGLANGPKSIFINGTPLQNSDGTFNFGGNITWDERVGLPSQAYMPGFPSASNVFNVGIQVKTTTPLTQTTSATNIDQMRVTIGLPNGLCLQDTGSNALVGSSVQLQIDKKLTSSGSWITDRVVTIQGKTTSAYEQDVLIDRPAGTGTWDVRMTRITADSTVATLKNDTYWQTYEEIQNVQLEYDYLAYIGLAVNAKDLGTTSIPTISFDVFGLYVRVPSNYDPVACTYTGVWDGTFKMAWTDNPAWHLLDLITHNRYGLGPRLNDDFVDKWSFYSTAVYNDGLVSDGNGGTERRFTCNVPLQSRANALQVCSDLASNMHAQIVWLGNRVYLIQDRPTSSTRLLVPADVINGLFDYSSTTLADRYTVANVTWNNPADNYLQAIENISAGSESGTWATTLSNAQTTYGYNVEEVAAFGCTRRSQARRHGRWILDSVLNLTDLVKFQMSPRGFDIQVGDVVTISDPYYAGQQLGGLTAAGSTTTTIQLDRPIMITAGSTISIGLATGVETQTISTAAGTVSAVTVSTPFSAAPDAQATFIVTTAIAPRQFKISKITQSAPGVIDVQGLLYDPNKWDRIEGNLSLPAPVFSAFTALNPTTAPTSLTFQQQAQFVDNSVKRSLIVGWTPPSSGTVASYSILYRQALDQWQEVDSATNSVEIDGLVNGDVDVKVYAINPKGVQSPPLTGSFTININGGSSTALDTVTSLGELSTGSTSTFTGPDVNIKWTNPLSNAGRPISLKDFQVQVINPSTRAVLRTEYVAAVAPGSVQTYSYTMAKNNADNANVPLRGLTFSVAPRDSNNNVGDSVSVTLANPAPAAVSALTLTASFKNNFLSWTRPADADYEGVMVWGSRTSGFSPSSTNLLTSGDISAFTHSGLGDSETWYYRVAAFDAFSQSADGADLNLSSELTATTLNAISENEYQLNGVTWTPNSPSTNSVAWTACTAVQTLGTEAGGTVAVNSGSAAWSSGVLYIYYLAGNSTLQTTTVLANAVGNDRAIVATYRGGTNLEHGDGRAYMDGSLLLAGTVGASQLVTGSAVITQGAQIASAIISDAHITSLDGSKINANTVTASQIASGTITASQIQAGSVTADRIDSRGLLVKDSAGNVLFGAGFPLAYGNVSGGPPSNATNGATFGVNIGGQITSGNVSTYIASAAIQNAQMGSASVDTLNIAGNAVTIPVSYSTSSSASMLAGSEQTLAQLPSYTSKGGQVVIMFGGTMSVAPDANVTGTWRIRRNGTQIWTSGVVPLDINTSFVALPPVTDTPGNGAYVTYTVTWQVSSTGGASLATLAARAAYGLETIK